MVQLAQYKTIWYNPPNPPCFHNRRRPYIPNFQRIPPFFIFHKICAVRYSIVKYHKYFSDEHILGFITTPYKWFITLKYDSMLKFHINDNFSMTNELYDCLGFKAITYLFYHIENVLILIKKKKPEDQWIMPSILEIILFNTALFVV